MSISIEVLNIYAFKEILSYLDWQEIINFSLVSEHCEKVVNEIFRPRLKMDLKWLAKKPDFFTYFPQWKEVFEYFENEADIRDLMIFVEGMKHFHEKKNYIFENLALRQTTTPAHHPIHFAIVRRKYDFLKVLMKSPADFSELATENFLSPFDIIWQCGTSAQIFDLFITNLEAKSIEHRNLDRALSDAICNRDGYVAFNLIQLAVNQRQYGWIIKPKTFLKACQYMSKMYPNIIEYIIINSNNLPPGLLNATDQDGRTGLYHILSHSELNLKLVRFCLDNAVKYGLNTCLMDNSGFTPCQMAFDKIHYFNHHNEVFFEHTTLK